MHDYAAENEIFITLIRKIHTWDAKDVLSHEVSQSESEGKIVNLYSVDCL